MIRCSNCGMNNNEDANFCIKCGSKIDNLEVEKPTKKKSKVGKCIVVGFILTVIIAIGYVMIYPEATVGYSVDVGFRDGTYKTYDHIEGWELTHDGVFSDTYDLHTTYGKTIRLHYVTSIRIVR